MPDPRMMALLRRLQTGQLSRRQFIRRALALGVSAPAISAVLSQTAAAAPAGRPAALASRMQSDAKTLVLADDLSGGLWLSLDPGNFYEVDPTAAMNVIYETLYHIPDTTKPADFEPLLATGMPELSADGREATIKLRPGVKFHTSGNVMTGDDIIFSWNRLKNLQTSGAYLAEYWTSVDKIDDNTIKIVLPDPNPALVAILCSTPLSITDSKTVRAHGGTDEAGAADKEKSTNVKQWISQNSVGTGPYKVATWNIPNEVDIVRNPDYWGEAPKLDRIIWHAIKDASSQLQALQTGEADLAYAFDPDSASKVKSDPNLQLLSTKTISLEYLALHTQPNPGGPLAKVDVRQAISYAIDYNGIIRGLLDGFADRPATIVPLTMPGADQVESLKHNTDLAKAQQLFDSAGVGNVQLSLSYRAGGAGMGGLSEDTLATKLKSDLEKIKGLKIKLVPMDPTQWITDYRASKLQFTISPWGPDYPDVQSYVQPFGSTTGAVALRVGYKDPKNDDILKQIASETDPIKRAAGDAEIQKNLIADMPYIVLYQPLDQRPARKVVQGVQDHFYYGFQLRYASKTAP